MNPLATARLAANMMLIVAVAILTVFVAFGGSMEPSYLVGLGAISVLGGLGQFTVSIIRPRSIKSTWDEQNVASHRGSYQFGYWSALIGFWSLFVMIHWYGTDVGNAILWIGAILITAPSIWMVVATALGRAG